ncbi:hypothetical protein POTOM_032793 [Populus tomentosa]|uniref:glucan endo-1,3-beta-D-glucosidase n=1 Tax=Populus tomentosa TaxID=118781 RepID=A0A8X7Z546_POPTO|nr:hypothetical protein POTOM_032793 [Populus tomentosa]
MKYTGDANARYVLPAMQNMHDAIVSANLQGQIKVSTAIDTTLCTDNPQSIDLNCALFTSPEVVVQDGQYGYQNLFDALLDALYAALEKAGAPNLNIAVSESGWSSEGGNAATVGNAGTFYRNLINHVKQGTPRRSGRALETYLFAMFDENLKAAGIEQHFGLFLPDRQPKYHLTFG